MLHLITYIMLLLRGEHFSRPCQTAPTFHILSRWSLSPPVQSCLCSAHEQSRVVLGNFSPRTEKVMASWSTGPAQECDVVMQGTGSERRWHLEGSLCRAFSSAACRPWRQGCCFLGSWVIHLRFCCIHHTDSSLAPLGWLMKVHYSLAMLISILPAAV